MVCIIVQNILLKRLGFNGSSAFACCIAGLETKIRTEQGGLIAKGLKNDGSKKNTNNVNKEEGTIQTEKEINQSCFSLKAHKGK